MSKRHLWYTADGEAPIQVELHAIDANHALAVDPAHWSAEKPVEPEPEAMPEPIPPHGAETEF